MLTAKPQRGNTVLSLFNNKFLLKGKMYYNNIEFKPYDDCYYVSANGDVFSKYKNGLLKHYIDLDGYHRVDIHGTHKKIHRMVYLVWNGQIPEGMQVNHYDDNKDNNNKDNLYVGSQKENISDCCKNKHRVGNINSITVYDKEKQIIINFPTIKDFILYTEHSIQNGSLSHIKNKKWFMQRFDIIEKKSVTTIESYKSIRANYNGWVENKANMHEASRVGQNLSLFEAQGTEKSVKR